MEDMYESYGGEEFWDKVMDQFYERNRGDLKLQHLFEGKDVERIKRMNKCLLTSALKGTNLYSHVDVQRVHSSLGIKSEHFDRFMLNFYNTLNSNNIKEEDLEFMLVLIDSFKDEVVA